MLQRSILTFDCGSLVRQFISNTNENKNDDRFNSNQYVRTLINNLVNSDTISSTLETRTPLLVDIKPAAIVLYVKE